MLAGESVPDRSRVTRLSPARVGPVIAAQGRPSFQSALLIAAATGNRHVLACDPNLEVIPVTGGVSSWKVSRQRLTPASCSSLPSSRISRRRRGCRFVKPTGDEDLTPHQMVPRSLSMSSSLSRFSGCRSRSLSLGEGLPDSTGARDGTRADGVLDRGRRRLFSF